MNYNQFHSFIDSGLFIGIVLLLVWVGSIRTKVDTMWTWWCNHTARGTKLRMKEDGD